MRFLFYSHDAVGLGHTRRHLAIAATLTQMCREATILLVSGAEEVIDCGLPPRIDVLKLPGLRKAANDHYLARRLHIPASEIRALRSALLQTAVKSFRPDVVLVDKHPFGAKGEFRDGLETARALGGRTALGLRDILDAPAAVLREWQPYHMQQRIGQHYDLVLIYGERAVFDPIAEYEFPTAMEERTHFCGYVVGHNDGQVGPGSSWTGLTRQPRARPVVLGTAGGGEDGYSLLAAFIRASRDAAWEAMVVTGPMTTPRDLKNLRLLATEAKVTLHTFVPSLSDLFGSVDALVCMGGYNTLVEAGSQGVPTVCVPRTAPRLEQRLRAESFAKLGLLTLLLPEHLNGLALHEAIHRTLDGARQNATRRRGVLNFNGARNAALHLLALASDKISVPVLAGESRLMMPQAQSAAAAFVVAAEKNGGAQRH